MSGGERVSAVQHERKLNTLQFKKTFGGIAAIATCTVVAVGLLGSAPAFADTPPDGTLGSVVRATPVVAAELLNPAEVTAEMDALRVHSTALDGATRNGTFYFDEAIEAGVPEDMAREWAHGYALGGGMVVGVKEPVTISARAACRGTNQIWADWLGAHAKFSSCVVPKVTSALQSGVGATAFAAGIAAAASLGVGAVTAIVPALMQYSVWSIQACAANGTGVELAFAGFVCWAQ